MFVWIPRYTYKINGEKEIDIKFSDGLTDDTADGFLKHPGFTFGNDELSGIWIAKFMASPNGTAVMQFKPGAASMRPLSVSQGFTRSRNFQNEQTLGANADSHMLKGTEWGAAAYLTQAIGSLPQINSNNGYITGGSAIISDVWTVNAGQSTTGNPYGIYDMNGGSHEYLAVYNYGGNAASAAELINAPSKYKNVIGNFPSLNPELWTTYGMAIEETSVPGDLLSTNSWGGAYSEYPTSGEPHIMSGGTFAPLNAGGLYCYRRTTGSAGGVTTRAALAVTGAAALENKITAVKYTDSAGNDIKRLSDVACSDLTVSVRTKNYIDTSGMAFICEIYEKDTNASFALRADIRAETVTGKIETYSVTFYGLPTDFGDDKYCIKSYFWTEINDFMPVYPSVQFI
jgi:hypothetical protein